MYEDYMETVYARLDKYTIKTDGCWNWVGAKDSRGYGVLTVGKPIKRVVKAHRLSWQRVNGPIPKSDTYHGTCVWHSCDNPGCVNPDHLFIGGNGENLKDMASKNRGRSGNTKLDAEKVKEIRIRAEYETRAELARRFGVQISTISSILDGKTWRWVS